MAPRARWNPCRAIRYRVNTRGAPRRGLRDVRRAFRKARRVSGIRFRYAGHTHRIPMRKHANPYAFGAWRKRDDIVVAWPRRAQTAYFGRGDRAIGYGGSYSTGRARHHGYLLLRRHSHLKAGFGKGRRHGWLGTQGQLYLHEIGHVIGLDHVNRRSQIMYPTMTRKRAKYRAGDRRGLRRLGRRQGCIRGW